MYPNPDEGTKVYLKKGQKYRFDLNSDEEGDDERVSLPHPDVMEALEVGHRVLIDDGKIMVRTHVLTCSRAHVLTYSRTHVLTCSRAHVLTLRYSGVHGLQGRRIEKAGRELTPNTALRSLPRSLARFFVHHPHHPHRPATPNHSLTVPCI